MGGGGSKSDPAKASGDSKVLNKMIKGNDDSTNTRDMSILNFHTDTGLLFIVVAVVFLLVVVAVIMMIMMKYQGQIWHCLDQRTSEREKERRRAKVKAQHVREFFQTVGARNMLGDPRNWENMMAALDPQLPNGLIKFSSTLDMHKDVESGVKREYNKEGPGYIRPDVFTF